MDHLKADQLRLPENPLMVEFSKQEQEAIVKIQKVFRGYLTRKNISAKVSKKRLSKVHKKQTFLSVIKNNPVKVITSLFVSYLALFSRLSPLSSITKPIVQPVIDQTSYALAGINQQYIPTDYCSSLALYPEVTSFIGENFGYTGSIDKSWSLEQELYSCERKKLPKDLSKRLPESLDSLKQSTFLDFSDLSSDQIRSFLPTLKKVLPEGSSVLKNTYYLITRNSLSQKLSSLFPKSLEKLTTVESFDLSNLNKQELYTTWSTIFIDIADELFPREKRPSIPLEESSLYLVNKFDLPKEYSKQLPKTLKELKKATSLNLDLSYKLDLRHKLDPFELLKGLIEKASKLEKITISNIHDDNKEGLNAFLKNLDIETLKFFDLSAILDKIELSSLDLETREKVYQFEKNKLSSSLFLPIKIQNLEKIEKLSIKHDRPYSNSSYPESFFPFLNQFKNIKEITLSQNNISLKEAKYIVKYIQSSPQLKFFHITNNIFQEDSLRLIIEALNNHPNEDLQIEIPNDNRVVFKKLARKNIRNMLNLNNLKLTFDLNNLKLTFDLNQVSTLEELYSKLSEMRADSNNKKVKNLPKIASKSQKEQQNIENWIKSLYSTKDIVITQVESN